jgi:hypothetical protein
MIMKGLYNYLLRPTELTVAEIAETVYGVAGVGPVGSASDVFAESKAMIGKIIYKYLDFDRFKTTDGTFINNLPSELGKDEVVQMVSDEYDRYISGLDMKSLICTAEAETVRRVEHHIWLNGLQKVYEAISLAERNIAECAVQYASLHSDPDSSALEKSYAHAMKLSLAERVMGTNDEDILVYRNDMVEYLEVVCANMRYAFWERFFTILSCSSIFAELCTRIEDLMNLLKETGATGEYDGDEGLQDSIPDGDTVILLDTENDVKSALAKAEDMISDLWKIG